MSDPSPVERRQRPPDIPNYLVQSILVTIFCCLPFGIVAIINAAQVGSKLGVGDIAGASEASEKAKKWCWVSFWIGLVAVVFGLSFAVLMSERLRRLVERVFGLGLLSRFLPLYQNLSDSVQVYRTHTGALAVALGWGLATVLATCVVNYLAAVAVGTDVPLAWVFVLTPLTAFAPFLPSIASGLGWNQGVFIVLYKDLAGVVSSGAPAFAMSMAMQAIIMASSLPGAVLWWRRRSTTAPPVSTT